MVILMKWESLNSGFSEESFRQHLTFTAKEELRQIANSWTMVSQEQI